MKPFNLKEALAGKRVVTRRGDAVSQIHVFDTARDYRLGFVVNGSIYVSRESGCFSENASPSDLFMATEKKIGWINLYKANRMPACGCVVYPSKEEAEKGRQSTDWIGSLQIEWEE